MMSSSGKNLFTPIKMGLLELPNRIAMTALTRCRADPSTGVPNDLHIQYYSERAEGAAFIMTEATAITKSTCTYPGGCGIWSEEQIDGWSKVCQAVHKVGGRIFLQIWHGGRACRSKTTGSKPVGPSPIPIRSQENPEAEVKYSETPEELTEEGILQIVEDFRKGAENALRAGFDGLQLHGANGYLIDNFLRDCSNKRTDKYGGSIENRCRFPLMVIEALSSIFGPDRVGIKLTPTGRYMDMFDSDPFAVFSYFLQELSKLKIGFVEVLRADEVEIYNLYNASQKEQMPNAFKMLRPYFSGIFMGNNGVTFEEGNKLIEEGVVDMVGFGRYFISNPDLIERLKNGWELNQLDYSTCYTPGPKGYIDYPRYKKEN